MATTNSQEAGSLLDQSIPQWKRELIARRRALGRTLQLGSTTVKLTCPSVVAAVRQPEAIAAVENVIGKQQRCISSVAASNKSSLDQNQADFHPGPSSAVTVAVGNMRLLDKCMNVNNEFVINGSDIQNYRQSEVDTSAFQYISSNMGEEKPVTNLKNTSASNKSVMEKISVKIPRQISIKKENRQPSKNGNNDDCLSDSSEEFQYGPGIVNRLKTRYLSMTLRESQKKGLRPSLSSMRRATSLENMLDEDISSNKTTKTNNRSSSKNDNSTNVLNKVTNISYRTSKHTGLNRGSDSMKRARSMDTLLKADHKSSVLQNHAVLRPKSLISDRPVSNGSTNAVVSIINEDLIIVENTSVDGNTSSNDEHQGLRFRRNAEERDLPPPDVVKQTLKLFETSPSKKSKTIQSKAPINNKVSSSNSVNSLKYNGDKQKADFVYKPILSPKPVLSPEKLRSNRSNRISSPKKIGLQISNNNAILSPRGFTRKRDIEPLSLTISNNTSTGSEIPPLASPRTVSPRCVSPIVTVISHSEQDQTILSPTSSTKLLNLNSRPESLTLNSSSNDDDFDSSDEGESKVPKPVSQTALENIRKGGTSTQFKFNSDNTQPTKIKSYLPGNKVHIQATNSLLVLSPTRQSSLPTATIAPLKSPDPLVPMPKQIGVIRPIVSTKIHPNIQSSSNPLSGLTEQEIEKNLINRVKSIEQPVSKVVVAIKSLPDNIVVGSVSTDSLSNNKGLSLPRVNPSVETKSQGLWDKKPWHQNQNTMVFNFSNRKDVPDYIENDGLILKGQRDRPRPGEGGIILLDNGGEESSTDADSEDWISDPPSPCDVTFEGDNVLINGKSNLSRQPKQRKLRIHFNDEATTVFEYPSETSLVEDEEPMTVTKTSEEVHTTSPTAAMPMGRPTRRKAPPLPNPVPQEPILLLESWPLGGTLGSYTPRQLGHGSGESFQLGVTRSLPTINPHYSEATPVTMPDDPHLKPAPPECIVAWSEGSAPDLLF